MARGQPALVWLEHAHITPASWCSRWCSKQGQPVCDRVARAEEACMERA